MGHKLILNRFEVDIGLSGGANKRVNQSTHSPIMQTTMLSAFLLVLALFSLILAANAVRTGEVVWRGGSVAARRSDDPGLFWLLVVAQAAISILIAWQALY